MTASRFRFGGNQRNQRIASWLYCEPNFQIFFFFFIFPVALNRASPVSLELLTENVDKKNGP